ncbi:MAG TPA: response regulator transcription factor [Acidimicrobiales bacterium]
MDLLGNGGVPLNVLVADDEEYITDVLTAGLRFLGFHVSVARNGLDAIAKTVDTRPDVMLLDVAMPGCDGFEVCRRLRDDGVQTPIIFLTARDASEDKVSGLRLGGDDYVTKPFGLEEVVARIEAVLRRSSGGARTVTRLTVGDLVLDDEAHEVTRGDERIELSATEYRVLRYLMMNAGRVLSKSQILEHVWQYDFDGESTVVETYISYLRKKVDAVDPPLIHTIRGFGYVIRIDPDS